MNRFLVALAVLFVCCVSLSADAADRPNILVFLVDDMGLMDSSVPFLTDENGRPERHPLNEFYRTPQMERLAAQGIRFSNFYAMSVCSPTRVSIMTGQTSARHRTTCWINPETNNAGPFGAPDWQWEGITPQHVTLPALLHDAGYRTIHCGKGHFGSDGTYGEIPSNFGFDVNIAGGAIGAPGSYYASKNFGKGIRRRAHRAVPGLEKYHGQEIYLTEVLTLEINDAIESAVKADQPFFAYMSHYAVHAPFEPDPRFVGHYADAENPRVAAFASMIEGMDKSLGDILDQLEALGVAEETLVFFLGDNGTDAPLGPLHEIACAAPLRGKKGTHYEGGMRVPFIAAWARSNREHPLQQATPIAQGAVTDQLGAVYDLFPTILAVTGVEGSSGKNAPRIDGVDLRPFLTGDQPQEEREFLMHFPHAHRSSYFTTYRNGDWKVIYHYRPDPKATWEQVELYNLAEDRDESHNLATSRPEKLREMFASMQAALDDAAAQYPLADDKEQRLEPALP